MSYAEEKGFADALLEKHDKTLPNAHNTGLDETIPKEKEQKMARERNAQAMRALIGSLKSDHDKHKIPRARKIDETNWPNGKAWTVWKALKKEYQPDDATAEAEMENALHKIKLNKKSNPVHVLDEIAAVEARYGKTVSDSRKRAIVLNVGKEYNQTISMANLMYQKMMTRLPTAEELIEEMEKSWRLSGSADDYKSPSDSGTETALGAFKGKCNKCKQKGHKAEDCPGTAKAKSANAETGKTGATSEKAAGANSDVKCGHCKKSGHKEESCWVKYPKKVPEWAKEL
jgi:hypothetical protein